LKQTGKNGIGYRQWKCWEENQRQSSDSNASVRPALEKSDNCGLFISKYVISDILMYYLNRFSTFILQIISSAGKQWFNFREK
jgi:hypothetical protein